MLILFRENFSNKFKENSLGELLLATLLTKMKIGR